MRRLAAPFLLSLIVATAPAADTPPIKAGLRRPDAPPAAKPTAPMPRPAKQEPTRADRLKSARDGYQSYCTSWVDALRRAETEKEKEQLLKKLPDPVPYATRAAQLVLEDPKDDVAFDALSWLVRYQTIPEVKKALAKVLPAKKGNGEVQRLDVFAALTKHHLNNPKLANVARGLYQHTDDNEAFLEAVFEQTTDPKVRGFAGEALAGMLAGKSEEPDMADALRGKYLKEADAVYTKLLADKDVMAVVYKDKDGKEHTLGETLPDDRRAVRELSIGKTLPDILGTALDGKSARAADYKGKVLVLDVWATWCGPCRAMIPHEREMVGRLKGKPFALVSVSCDEEKDTLTDFLDNEGMPWAHWWDGKDGPVNKALAIRFYPTIYVIDAKGVIRFKNLRDEKLEEAVNKLLKEMDAESAGGR